MCGSRSEQPISCCPSACLTCNEVSSALFTSFFCFDCSYIIQLIYFRNPGNSKYYNFDISEGEHDIITHEERQPRPKTIQEVMKNVVIYVEIRNADDNRTAGVKNIISDLGARVNDKLLR